MTCATFVFGITVQEYYAQQMFYICFCTVMLSDWSSTLYHCIGISLPINT